MQQLVQLLVFLFTKVVEPDKKKVTPDLQVTVDCRCLVCLPLVSAKMSHVIPALSLLQETPPFTFHWLNFQVSRQLPLSLYFFPLLSASSVPSGHLFTYNNYFFLLGS